MKKIQSLLHFTKKIILEKTVREGLLLSLPFVLVGAAALTICAFPLPAYQYFIHTAWDGRFYAIFSTLHAYTIRINPLLFLLTMSFSFGRAVAESTKEILYYPATALISYMIIFAPVNDLSWTDVFGPLQAFIAILVTITSCLLLYGLKKQKIFHLEKLLPSYDPTFYTIFLMSAPIAVVFVIFAALSLSFNAGFEKMVSDFHFRIFDYLGYNGFGAAIYIFLEQFYWFFGIHGSNILDPVSIQLFESHMAKNTALVAQGLQPVYIYTKTFFDAFVIIGGCGSALSLVLAVFLYARLPNTRRVAKLSLLPCLFNISEVILIGLPVICNGIFFIPFLLVPLIFLLIGALAIQCGLVPIPSYPVAWTMPPLFNAYLTTGSLAGPCLQLFSLACGILIYRPFIRKYEQNEEKKLKSAFKRLIAEVITGEKNGYIPQIMQHPKFSSIAKVLASDLRHALQKKELQLFYQPQVNYDGTIYGGEALLRWKHPQFGYIYPPLIILLANENKFLDELGLYLIERACRDLEYLHKNLLFPVKISVNVSPPQLHNHRFCQQIRSLLRKYQFGNSIMAFEITEQIALSGGFDIQERLRELKSMGILLSMDDFGMGHSSVMYLQDSDFDIVKLDGALTKKVLESTRSLDIIQAITSLSQKFQFKVVAEYVETAEQRDKLAELGCFIYQGWLYSPAVSLTEFINFLQTHSQPLK